MKHYTLKKIFLTIALVIGTAQPVATWAIGYPWPSAPRPSAPTISPSTFHIKSSWWSQLTHNQKALLVGGLGLGAVVTGAYLGYKIYKKNNTTQNADSSQGSSTSLQQNFDAEQINETRNNKKTRLKNGILTVLAGSFALGCGHYLYTNKLVTSDNIIQRFTILSLLAGMTYQIFQVLIVAKLFGIPAPDIYYILTYKAPQNDPIKNFYAGEVPEDITRIIECIKNPMISFGYKQQDITPPKGIILYGPPGTGKTQLARYIADCANTNFIAVKPSDIHSSLMREGEKNIKSLFKQANALSNASGRKTIIFFDEIDSIAPSRNNATQHSENKAIVTELLTQLDGFQSNDNVIIIAGTNRLEDIDEAIKRSGRLGIHIKIDLPNQKNAYQIFLHHLKQKKHTLTDDSTEQIFTTIFKQHRNTLSSADIAEIINEAARTSVHVAAQDSAHLNSYITADLLIQASNKLYRQKNNTTTPSPDNSDNNKGDAGSAFMQVNDLL